MLLTLARVLLPKYPRCYKHITAIKRACPLVQHIKPLHTHSNMELNQTHKQHLEDIDTFMFDCDGMCEACGMVCMLCCVSICLQYMKLIIRAYLSIYLVVVA